MDGAVGRVPLTFITGPVRSGKSRLALKLARAREAHGASVTYIATATLGQGDAEWRDRLERHKDERDPAWSLIETAAPGAPAPETVMGRAGHGDILIVDSTATWLAARIDARLAAGTAIDAAALEPEASAFVDACARSEAYTIVVGDEIGWGVVPESAAVRHFRDVLGRMQQRLANEADRAFLVVAGRAIDLYEFGTAI